LRRLVVNVWSGSDTAVTLFAPTSATHVRYDVGSRT
jgi:hypothetical protein